MHHIHKADKFILWFNELGIEDVPVVGGKNASLGEMYRNLTKKGINIPNGFATTVNAYRYLLERAGIKEQIKHFLKGLNTSDVTDLARRGNAIRQLIRHAEFPPDLKDQIIRAYQKLCSQYGQNTDVAVRSSATAEDLPDASFAGQQETYLNIRGEHDLIDSCKKCFASLFTNRAISYRVDKGFDHFKIALSIGIQKMVRSDLASSGVMFTLDTESGFRNVVFITGSYGLGENIVQGAVNPDEYYVFKPSLKKGLKSIISKKVGEKKIKMIYTHDGNKTTKNVLVSEADRQKFVLTDSEILALAKWGCIIEDHYSKKAGHDKPMDIEWAKDGRTNKLFIVQARPETVHSSEKHNIYKSYVLKQKGKVIVTGHSIGEKIGAGKANVIKDVHGIAKFRKGEVLVTEMTDPDWEPILKLANGIVTNRGGRTCFSGSTNILTSKGFLTIEQIHSSLSPEKDIFVPSLDYTTNKIVWRKVIASIKKKSLVWKIQISPSLRSKQNFIAVTPDHKFYTLNNRAITKKETEDLIRDKEGVLVAERVPQWQNVVMNEKEAYLLGALLSDGFFTRNKQGGYVIGFVQKVNEIKKEFIETVCSNFQEVYGRDLRAVPDKRSDVVSFQCYSKQIYNQLVERENQLLNLVLALEKPNLLRFLAGVIDGDGHVSHHQIQITVAETNRKLLEAIIVASYRLGIIPTISKRKTWYVISFSEKVETLLTFTKRVKGTIKRCSAGKKFVAKQILSDIICRVNVRGRIKHSYLIRDRLITTTKIEKDILPRVKELKELRRLLNSEFSMQRLKLESKLGLQDVYDLTVEACEEMNHNYVVFTTNYTPVIVSNCHAAIISRELGIPCVVGTNNGTGILKTGQPVTVDCSQGDEGFVYSGILKYSIEEHNLAHMPKTKTHIMMNIGDPEIAFKLSFLPNSGVGLAREEFIINSFIKIHPKALIMFDKLKDKKVIEEIQRLTLMYKDKKQFYTDKLAEGIATIATAFYPKDVIVRLADFKSNEYANLIGGKLFEPLEDNPMIGWRGASRYYDKKYKDCFALECKAIKKVREEFGLTNVILMVPFCRTIAEAKKVLLGMKKNGLEQHKNGLKVYAMCEIPSNVILAEQFLDIFDGFSIGSNDLTQLTLGVDRDSELIAHIFDEGNEAVKSLIEHVIKTANKKGKYIGLCGQKPSDDTGFAQFLVKAGIKSISLNPDTVIKTTLKIAEQEKKLGLH